MNTYIKIVAVLGVVAVSIGAFGAHGLEPYLDAKKVATFKTASLYHYIHLLVMLVLAFKLNSPNKVLQTSYWLFFVGIIMFSGSLYILSTKDLIGGDVWNVVGPITPIGGLFFILGWANLFRYKHLN